MVGHEVLVMSHIVLLTVQKPGQASWCHTGSFKSATAEVFTPRKIVKATNSKEMIPQAFYCLSFESWGILAVCISISVYNWALGARALGCLRCCAKSLHDRE